MFGAPTVRLFRHLPDTGSRVRRLLKGPEPRPPDTPFKTLKE